MNTFNGRVKVLAGTIKTIQELIQTALGARTYSAVTATNTIQKAQAQSIWRNQSSTMLRFKAEANVIMCDAWKGNNNGVINQSAWTLPGDLTASPGGGETVDGGVEKLLPYRVDLSSRAFYADADTYIDLDVTSE